jgi:hypothetical protein
MKRSAHILSLLLVACSLLLVGCDHHEWVEYEPAEPTCDVKIRLTFSTPLPLFREVDYARSGTLTDANHNVRYIVQAYQANATSDPQRFVFTKQIDGEWDCELPLELPAGSYDLYVWADFVENGSQVDLYQTTTDFEHITLTTPHSGNNEYRDSFRGILKGVTITAPADEATPAETQIIDISMVRPLAKYIFVSTDIKEFVARERARIEAKGMSLEMFNHTYSRGSRSGDADTEAADASAEAEDGGATPLDADSRSTPYIIDGLDLSAYQVMFIYTGYMPNTFNMFADKPIDATTGINFTGFITKEDDSNDAILGFDYVMVNGVESAVQVALRVIAPDDEVVSSTSTIDVPITRSQLTVVRGEFLSQQTTGGVGINPDFDGMFIVYY